jgi:hypothetical protein
MDLADRICIPYPRYDRAKLTIHRVVEHAKSGGLRGTRGVLLTGRSQSGKTTLLRDIRDAANTREALGEGRVPVLLVSLTPNATRKSLLQDILRQLEAEQGVVTDWQRGVETVLASKVERFLPHMGVELLVLDEFQHLVNSDNQNVASSVADMVKSLLIKGVCPIVMSGTEDAWKPVKANQQLALRCEQPQHLRPLDALDEQDAEEFATFLVQYLVELEAREISPEATAILDEADIVLAIHEVAGGILGRACNLLKDAIAEAADNQRDRFFLSDLSRIVNLGWLPQGLCNRNPFTDGLATAAPARRSERSLR